MDEWTELNPYAIAHPDGWTIAKYAVAEAWKYMLWQGNAMKGVFDASEDAKAEFERLSQL